MSTIAIRDLAITLVEPSAMQGQFIARHLRDLEVQEPQLVQSGSEALASLRRFRPDLVISAMYLPDMTGAELVEAMRRDPALEAVPFMLISSETSLPPTAYPWAVSSVTVIVESVAPSATRPVSGAASTVEDSGSTSSR